MAPPAPGAGSPVVPPSGPTLYRAGISLPRHQPGHGPREVPPRVVVEQDRRRVRVPAELLGGPDVAPRRLEGLRDGAMADPVGTGRAFDPRLAAELADDVIDPRPRQPPAGPAGAQVDEE